MKLTNALPLALFCAATLTVTPLLAGDGPAGAPTAAERDEAQRRYQRGRELYDENDFAAALVEIRRAYELVHSYKLLYDIGQICYQMQDYPCSLRSFTRYLEDGRDEIAAQRKADVQRDLERLKTRVATLRITTTRPGAEILVDDVSQGTTPLPAGVLVSAGRRKVTARIEGAAPLTKVIEVAGGDAMDVTLDVGAGGGAGAAPAATEGAPTASPSVAPSTAPVAGERKVPILPWVLTGAFAIGAGVTGGLALSASSDYKAKLDTFGTTRADLDSAGGTMRGLAIASDVFWGATAIAGVTALVLTITAGPSPKTTARVSAGPGGVRVEGSF